MLRNCTLIFFICLLFFTCKRRHDGHVKIHAPFLLIETSWADSVLLSMSVDEKIGQLIFLKSNLDQTSPTDSIQSWATAGKIGGLSLDQITVDTFIQTVNTCQKDARIPLFVGTEQSVVLNNQFVDVPQFPTSATMSAIRADSVHDQIRNLYIEQAKALGINFCIAPSVNKIEKGDSLYQPNIFESDREALIHRSSKMLHRIQNEKILAIAHDFNDYHYIENDTTGILDSILNRYYNLSQNGVSGFRIDPSIYQIDTINSLQTYFLQRYLREKIEFTGLMVSELDEDATMDELIHAGTDVFVVNDNPNKAFNHLKNFVEEGLMSKRALNEKVRKVLMAKNWMRLDSIRPTIDSELATTLLNDERFDYNIRQLHESGITLAHNPKNVLPFTKTYKRDFRLVQVGKRRLKTFNDYFLKYANFNKYHYPPDTTGKIESIDLARFRSATTIVTLDNIQVDTFINKQFIKSVNELSKRGKVVLVNYGNPLNLQYFDSTLIMVHVFERNKTTEALVPQVLFGGTTANGRLPLAIAKHLPFDKSTATPITRLKYTVPEEVGIAAYKMVGIDAIAQNAIFGGAMPGCQVLVAKGGKVIYSKSFGYHTYARKDAVKETDLYDIASITKIAATSLSSMKLYDEKKFKITDKLSQHVDCGEKSKLKSIQLKRLFTHQSRLQANMPIADYILYKDTANVDCNQYFCTTQKEDYTVQLSDSLYMREGVKDSLWQDVFDLRLFRRTKYRYSDVNFNLLQKVIENKVEKGLDEYSEEQFYNPLNLRNTLYNPRKKIAAERLVPTQNDEKWRRATLRGFVHDESAALQGGVGGNAGLFSNTNDLAILFQMILNGGTYAEQNFVKPETVTYFTSARHGNHRGLGFDINRKGRTKSISPKASKKTYGHTGFTGTCVWIDPTEDLVFIFLSNRIHPDIKNKTMFRNKIRSRLHSVVYDALNTYGKSEKKKKPSYQQAKLNL